MQILAVAGTAIWFLLTGLLWYLKPSDLLWFLGSLALAAVYFTAFFFYVTRPK